MKKSQNFANKILIFFFNLTGSDPVQWVGRNLAQMHGLGSAQPVWTVPSTVHMLREQWRRGRDEAGEKKKGRRVDLRWLLLSAELLKATGSGAGGLRWWQRLCFFPLSLSSIFCSLFSFGLQLLPSSALPSLLFSSLSRCPSSLLSPLFLVVPPLCSLLLLSSSPLFL